MEGTRTLKDEDDGSYSNKDRKKRRNSRAAIKLFRLAKLTFSSVVVGSVLLTAAALIPPPSTHAPMLFHLHRIYFFFCYCFASSSPFNSHSLFNDCCRCCRRSVGPSCGGSECKNIIGERDCLNFQFQNLAKRESRNLSLSSSDSSFKLAVELQFRLDRTDSSRVN